MSATSKEEPPPPLSLSSSPSSSLLLPLLTLSSSSPIQVPPQDHSIEDLKDGGGEEEDEEDVKGEGIRFCALQDLLDTEEVQRILTPEECAPVVKEESSVQQPLLSLSISDLASDLESVSIIPIIPVEKGIRDNNDDCPKNPDSDQSSSSSKTDPHDDDEGVVAQPSLPSSTDVEESSGIVRCILCASKITSNNRLRVKKTTNANVPEPGSRIKYESDNEEDDDGDLSENPSEEEVRNGLLLATQVVFKLSPEALEEIRSTFGDAEEWGLSFCKGCWCIIPETRGFLAHLEELTIPLEEFRRKIVDDAVERVKEKEDPVTLKDAICQIIKNRASQTSSSNENDKLPNPTDQIECVPLHAKTGKSSLPENSVHNGHNEADEESNSDTEESESGEDEGGNNENDDGSGFDDDESDDDSVSDFDGLGEIIDPADAEDSLNIPIKAEIDDSLFNPGAAEEDNLWFFGGSDDDDDGVEESNYGEEEHYGTDDDVEEYHSESESRIIKRKRSISRPQYSQPRSKRFKSKKKKIRKQESIETTQRNTARKYQFRCKDDNCVQYFANEFFRDAHYRRKHMGILLCFNCDRCGKGFRRTCDLYPHVRTCKGIEKDSRLGPDGDESFDKSSVNGRVFTPWSCSECGKFFRDNQRLEVHVQSRHLAKELLYSCSACQESFKDIPLLKQHLPSHVTGDQLLPASPFQCTLCQKMCATEDMLETHIDDHHRCPHCPMILKMRGAKEKHIRFVHEKIVDFACEYCELSFREKCDLATHMVFKHHEILGIETFMCNLCEGGKKFDSGRRLRAHMTQLHQTDLPQLPCDVCSRVFYHSGLLALHKKSHEQRTEVVCEICGKCVLSKRRLRTHILNHHSEEGKRICEACGKVMTQTGVSRHVCAAGDGPPPVRRKYRKRREKEEEEGKAKKKEKESPSGPPICHICGRQFVSHHAVKKHMKQGHNPTSNSKRKKYYYTCSVCNITFTVRSHLCKHMVNVHNMEAPPPEKKPGKPKGRKRIDPPKDQEVFQPKTEPPQLQSPSPSSHLLPPFRVQPQLPQLPPLRLQTHLLQFQQVRLQSHLPYLESPSPRFQCHSPHFQSPSPHLQSQSHSPHLQSPSPRLPTHLQSPGLQSHSPSPLLQSNSHSPLLQSHSPSPHVHSQTSSLESTPPPQPQTHSQQQQQQQQPPPGYNRQLPLPPPPDSYNYYPNPNYGRPHSYF